MRPVTIAAALVELERMKFAPEQEGYLEVLREELGKAQAEVERLKAEVADLQGVEARARAAIKAIRDALDAAEQKVKELEARVDELQRTGMARDQEMAQGGAIAERSRIREGLAALPRYDKYHYVTQNDSEIAKHEHGDYLKRADALALVEKP